MNQIIILELEDIFIQIKALRCPVECEIVFALLSKADAIWQFCSDQRENSKYVETNKYHMLSFVHST